MKNRILLLSFLLVFLMAGNALPLSLGTNITISDELYTGGNGWHSNREDQEVEPYCQPGQEWDLEAFFLKDTTLTMVAGFDFKDGASGYDSGDIFIDVTGDARYGPDNYVGGTPNGSVDVKDTFGYEYALDLDFSIYDAESGTFTYYLWALDSDDTTVTVFFGQNEEANPWEYKKDGILVKTGSFTFYEGLSNDDVDGLLGVTHYAAAVDLSFLAAETDFLAHFTYECGNDNLIGSGTTPAVSPTAAPEPATMLLLGTGLIGLAGLGRKKFQIG